MKCKSKIAYMRLEEALRACDKIVARTGEFRQAYLCANCQSYHLSSKIPYEYLRLVDRLVRKKK